MSLEPAPVVPPLTLADALEYDDTARLGDFLALWDARDSVEAPYSNFARVGPSAAAAQAATEADMRVQGVDPAGGRFRFFRVQGER